MYTLLKQDLLDDKIDLFKKRFKDKAPGFSTFNINQVDDKGQSLLHLAVLAGKLPFIKFLIAEKAEIRLADIEGNTALHLAVKKGFFNIVDELLGISAAAKARNQKRLWTDKDRNEKIDTIDDSQGNALTLLTVENNDNETPLMIAAQLSDDRIYKKLLAFKPGYEKQHLDKVLKKRQNRLGNMKIRVFFAALLESLCPSSSLAELTESFAYAGLTVGASAAAALGMSIAFAVVAVLGLGLITFGNFKKIQAEKNGREELENAQIQLAFITNIKARLKQLGLVPTLSPEQHRELESIRQELSTIQAPPQYKGDALSPANYIRREEKFYTFLSAAGSFLCAYSGLLGVVGLGLGITAAAMGLSLGGLIVSTGPIGIGVALGVGLLLAAGLAVYHYHKLNQDYLAFGEMRMAIHKQQDAIYREKQNLLHTDALAQVNALLTQSEPTQTISSVTPALTAPEKAASAPFLRSDCHGHEPGEICKKDVQILIKARSLTNLAQAAPSMNLNNGSRILYQAINP